MMDRQKVDGDSYLRVGTIDAFMDKKHRNKFERKKELLI